ncbi:MAG: transglycosylase SLT domain-containing protein [Aurantimonas endophytica]|uniref:Soluble lytic murein transglycosylase-like protein n=1 Tax=Aurantimonas endophytica TaxID=1522175 RepID=A0A7W6HBZ5_9HYPH|nr:transglycosylase SLT domain-containing protein [Aurantimonas endophytica]MBB4002317.1 soluble lytic murein transglycosylase-like protein [Aurantimonas endophytica]MCO6402059.1 transglycosylase SLT domain-containing protein [Aurantimonas endophytica]
MTRLTAAALAATIAFGLTTASTADPVRGNTEAGNVQMAAVERFADRPYATIIAAQAKAHGVPVALAHAVVQIESSYRSTVTGAAGEVGLMQIKPATARGMGYRGSTKALYDPATNIKWGMRYLAGAMQRGDGSTCGTILKYNAGHYAKRMNPISKRYCSKVQREMARA